MRKRKSREERLEEIFEGAKKVFLKKGIKNATMEDIISETSLSKGGMYHYYNNKEEIVYDILGVNSNKMTDSLKEILESMNSKKEFKEFFKKMFNNGLFVDNEEMKLYVIFVSEMIQDPKIIKYLKDGEDKYIKLIVEILMSKFSDLDRDTLDNNIRFMYYTLHANTYYIRVFGLDELYKRNLQKFDSLLEEMI